MVTLRLSPELAAAPLGQLLREAAQGRAVEEQHAAAAPLPWAAQNALGLGLRLRSQVLLQADFKYVSQWTVSTVKELVCEVKCTNAHGLQHPIGVRSYMSCVPVAP